MWAKFECFRATIDLTHNFVSHFEFDFFYRLKVRRDVNAASKFLVRYLNINLGRAEY